MAETKRRTLKAGDKIIVVTDKEKREMLARLREGSHAVVRLSASDLEKRGIRVRIINPQEERKLRAEIERSFENIELTRKRMANDQIEIDRLRNETRATIAQILA